MGLAGNDLANGFEIVIIWPSAGSAGRQGHIEGDRKENDSYYLLRDMHISKSLI